MKNVPIFSILKQFDCIYLYLSVSFNEKSLSFKFLTMLYFLLHYGNICSLIRLFYKISYFFRIHKIVRRCTIPRIPPLDSISIKLQDGTHYVILGG